MTEEYTRLREKHSDVTTTSHSEPYCHTCKESAPCSANTVLDLLWDAVAALNRVPLPVSGDPTETNLERTIRAVLLRAKEVGVPLE